MNYEKIYHFKDDTEPSLNEILVKVCDFLNVEITDVKFKTRKKEIVLARHLYFAAARILTKKALRLIGFEVEQSHCNVLAGELRIAIEEEKLLNKFLKKTYGK